MKSLPLLPMAALLTALMKVSLVHAAPVPATPPDKSVAALARLGAADRGFDVAGFLDTTAGRWSTETSGFAASHQEDDPAVIDRWARIGMRKQLVDAGSGATRFSLFTPVDSDVGSRARRYPLVVVNHGGGQSIFQAEMQGYVEVAAKMHFILAFINWDGAQATDADKAAAGRLGLHYEAYAFVRALGRIKQIAPVDPTRVYVVGFSGGGNATAYVGEEVPELVAGIAPSTGVMLQTIRADQLRKVSAIRVGLFLGCGTLDAEERWPIADTVKELGPVSHPATIAQRLESTNAWIRAAGAKGVLTSAADIPGLSRSGLDDASEKFGLRFDRQTKQILETSYYFGDYVDENGRSVVRFMAVGGQPHAMSPAWAEQSILFLSRFSRDQHTKKLAVRDF